MAGPTLRDAFGTGALPILNGVDVGAALLDGMPRWRPLTDAGLMRVWGGEADDAQFDRLAAAPGVGDFAVLARKPIETRRLASFDIPPPDSIKFDVQGAELAALNVGEDKLSALRLAECEAAFPPLYRGRPLFADVQSCFAARSFILHRLIDLASRVYRPVNIDGDPTRAASQRLWADAAFICAPRPDALWPPGGRLKAAIALHALYRSYDLALTLLRAHDVETDEACAAGYAAALALDLWFTNIRHG